METKIKGIRLPNKILALPNADKEFHEKWFKGRNLLNFPHPWRGLFISPPNLGKSNCVKNIILRANPPFEKVICIHCDPENTQEWDDCDAEMMGDIPAPDEWDGEEKTLVVIDDLELKGLCKEQRRNLDRLFGYVSTHRNVSVALCQQDAFNVPPICRRCSNLFVFWKTPDLDALSAVSRKTGMKSNNFNMIFKSLLTDQHDSLWIDLSAKSPCPLRKNGYKIIKKVEGSDSLNEIAKSDKFNEE